VWFSLFVVVVALRSPVHVSCGQWRFTGVTPRAPMGKLLPLKQNTSGNSGGRGQSCQEEERQKSKQAKPGMMVFSLCFKLNTN